MSSNPNQQSTAPAAPASEQPEPQRFPGALPNPVDVATTVLHRAEDAAAAAYHAVADPLAHAVNTLAGGGSEAILGILDDYTGGDEGAQQAAAAEGGDTTPRPGAKTRQMPVGPVNEQPTMIKVPDRPDDASAKSRHEPKEALDELAATTPSATGLLHSLTSTATSTASSALHAVEHASSVAFHTVTDPLVTAGAKGLESLETMAESLRGYLPPIEPGLTTTTTTEAGGATRPAQSAGEAARNLGGAAVDSAGLAALKAKDAAQGLAVIAGDAGAQAKDSTVSTAGAAKEGVVHAAQVARDSTVSAAASAKDAAARVGAQVMDTSVHAAQQARDMAVHAAEQIKDTSMHAAQQAKESATYAGERARDMAASATQQAKETASHLAQQAKATSVSAAEQAKDTGSRVMGQAKDTASHVADQAADTAARAKDSAGHAYVQATAAAQQAARGGYEQAERAVAAVTGSGGGDTAQQEQHPHPSHAATYYPHGSSDKRGRDPVAVLGVGSDVPEGADRPAFEQPPSQAKRGGPVQGEALPSEGHVAEPPALAKAILAGDEPTFAEMAAAGKGGAEE